MNDSKTVRTVATFFGRVQGVGFRDYVAGVARSFAVAGTVRNVRAHACVEIDVEGSQPDVDTAAPLGRRGFARAATR